MRKTLALLLFSFLLWHCNSSKKDAVTNELISTKLFAELPDYCPTPDAFALAPDGSLTLSCPNYADNSKPGVLIRIDKNRSVTKICEIPGVKEGQSARPMGIDYAPDGSLYVCANPEILKITFEKDTVKSIDVIARGINGPNGLKIKGDALYVTAPTLPNFKSAKNTSGVFRFLLSDRNVEVKGDSTDSNIIFTTETQNPRRQFGIDGLVFDKNGNLLAGDFGDGIIYQLKLNSLGRVESSEIYTTVPDSTGIDGMVMDENGNLFVAGFSQNEIWKIDAEKNAKVIARYPDNNGANGELDQPVDLVIHNGKLIISNFDLMTDPDMVNRSHDKPYTLSYIELTK